MRRWLALLGGLCALALLCAGLMLRGVIRLNHPKHPVWGVDVSHHQGEIDWEKLAAQGVRFAFIKATEGSTHVDDRFRQNIAAARAAGIRAGAYHFFSFDSPGGTQAKNFLREIGDPDLPPVVDFEYYGDKVKNPPDIEQTRAELRILLSALEAGCGKRPLLYATPGAHRRYLSGAFDDYDLWIRSVYVPPEWIGVRDWVFWQYSDRGLLEGYVGDEAFIDLNVFYGDEEEFKRYGA